MVVVFRNRLRADAPPKDYFELGERMYELASQMPGFIATKDFVAPDGERLTIIEFETAEQVAAWGAHAEHRAAQQSGRDVYYEEYSLQVCEQRRESRWQRP